MHIKITNYVKTIVFLLIRPRFHPQGRFGFTYFLELIDIYFSYNFNCVLFLLEGRHFNGCMVDSRRKNDIL